MRDEQVKKSIETGKLQLTFWLKLNHYGATIFLFIFALILFYIFYPINKPGDTFLILFPFIFLIVGIIIFFAKRKSLKFKSIDNKLPEKELLKIIKTIAEQFDWSLRLIKKNLIIAESNPIFITRFGELITVIITNDKVLINSISSPYRRFASGSMGWNNLNEKTLIEKIKKANQ